MPEQAGGKETVDGGIGPGAEVSVVDQPAGRGRQNRSRVGEFEPGMGGEEVPDDFLVLFRLKRAGGIDEDTVLGDERSGLVEDVDLHRLVSGDVILPAVPADIRMAAGDAGAGAGGIDQDTVKGRSLCGGEFLQGAAVRLAPVPGVQALQVFRHFSVPVAFRLQGDDPQIELSLISSSVAVLPPRPAQASR